jgi:hypothetical protein
MITQCHVALKVEFSSLYAYILRYNAAFINNSLKLCIKCLEDKMVNKILSMHILKEISLVYRISHSNVIHEVFEFTIRNLLK